MSAISSLTQEVKERLSKTSTATLATILYVHGFRSRVIRAARRLNPGPNMVGPVRTLRYVAMREDLDTLKNWVRDDNPQRQVCEEILPGEVLVIEAREDLSCGTMGGMLVARMFRRGAAGIVSDGPFRDTPFIASLDMPAYSVSMNANTNLISHHPEAMDVTITCGGVHVRVGDIAVGDQENVIIIPHAIVEDVAREAYRKEREEAFIERQILEGASLIGTYPMNEATRAKLAAEGGDDDGSG